MSKTTIPRGGITADAIDGTLIADDAINSEHYTDGSIDTAHIGDSQVTAVKTSGVGIQEFDAWRTTADEDISSTGRQYITNNWERVDDSEFEKIGTGMSESSGEFTFPSTGKYLITWHPVVSNRSGGTNRSHVYIFCEIAMTTNNSSYNSRAQSLMCFDDAAGAEYYNSATTQYLFDVTNTSTHKIKLAFYLGNGVTLQGDTNVLSAAVTFEKIGDT